MGDPTDMITELQFVCGSQRTQAQDVNQNKSNIPISRFVSKFTVIVSLKSPGECNKEVASPSDRFLNQVIKIKQVQEVLRKCRERYSE